MKRSYALALSALLCAIVPSHAANILWVSFHSGDDTPSANAATAGFTQAPDVGYTSLLAANGHTVTRYLTKDLPTQADIDVYNSADLVILSRSVPSGHYQQAGETMVWNSSVTKPVMVLGGYIIRNSRLGFMSGATIPDTAAPIRLTINEPAHPIFDGVSLDGSNVMVNTYAGIATFNAAAQRGISVVTNPVVAGGEVLATVGTAGDPAFGGTIIAEWAAGATLQPTDGGARNEVLGGPRLVFLTGSREQGITAEGAGIYDLTDDGARMFLNAVDYMAIPEPSVGALLIPGLLGLLGLRRRRP